MAARFCAVRCTASAATGTSGIATRLPARTFKPSDWRRVLYATSGVAIVLALEYSHVQDLWKSALDWIGNFGPWGPVIFVGLYVVATVFVTRLARRALAKKMGGNKTEQILKRG